MCRGFEIPVLGSAAFSGFRVERFRGLATLDFVSSCFLYLDDDVDYYCRHYYCYCYCCDHSCAVICVIAIVSRTLGSFVVVPETTYSFARVL